MSASSIETLRGTGVLKTARGEVVLAHADYVVTVTHPSNTDAPEKIEGRIVNAPDYGFDSGHVGLPMVLTLKDGRAWDCALVDASGRLAWRGQTFR